MEKRLTREEVVKRYNKLIEHSEKLVQLSQMQDELIQMYKEDAERREKGSQVVRYFMLIFVSIYVGWKIGELIHTI